MPWRNYTLFGRVEGKCWSAGAEGSGHDRVRVGMTGPGDVEARESGRRVGTGGDRPRLERSPSSGRDIGERVMGFSGIKAEAGVL